MTLRPSVRRCLRRACVTMVGLLSVSQSAAQPCSGDWLPGEVPAGLEELGSVETSYVTRAGELLVASRSWFPRTWDGITWRTLPEFPFLSGPSAMLELPNGDLVMGGDFSRASPNQHFSYLSRWDGQRWWPYVQPGTELLNAGAAVFAIAQMRGPQGYLVIGGSFSSVVGVPARGVAVLDEGQWRPLGSGFVRGFMTAPVRRLVIMPDGALVAGVGINESAFSVFASSVRRWDGTEWVSVGPPLIGDVADMTVWGEHGLIVVGRLSLGGTTTLQERIMAWDGQAWSELGNASGGSVACVVRSPDGRVMVGGTFSAINGVPANRAAIWNGQTWSPVSTVLDGGVRTLSLLADASIFAGGIFSLVDAIHSKYAAIFRDGEWAPTGFGPDGAVNALVSTSEGMMVGGAFTTVSGAAQQPVVRWDGASWRSLGPISAGGQVLAMSARESGDVVVGGRFGALGGVPASSIARWDGRAWSPLGAGAPDYVRSVAFLADGRIVAGGDFVQMGGMPAAHIALWNGNQWSVLGYGLNGTVQALAALPDGGFIAGGQFNSSATTPLAKIARWDGSAWRPLGSGLSDAVNVLALAPNGDLIAGGVFLAAGGVPANRIARWDGQSWSALGDGVNGEVRALAFDEAGSLYVGGAFTRAGGIPAAGLARWDGSGWSALGEGVVGTVNALAVDESGELVVGGSFGRVGVDPRRYFARWTPSGVAWFVDQPVGESLGCGETASFTASVARGYSGVGFEWFKNGQPVGDADPRISTVEAGGASTLTIRGVVASDAGTYTCEASNGCGSAVSLGAVLAVRNPADFDHNGGVDGADVEAFFLLWEAGESGADINRDGGVDGGDVEAFFVAWEGGGCG